MRQAIYKTLSATPAQAISVAGLVATGWSAGDPESFKKWWGWAMTPDHIRTAGIVGFVIFTLYWLTIWWLKPKETPSDIPNATTYTQNHTGSGDNNVDIRR